MKRYKSFLLRLLLPLLIMVAISCVEQIEYQINGSINLLVVDGHITNINEEQIVRIFRAKADPTSGRYGSLPVKGAKMELVINGTQVIPFIENTAIAGNYTLPPNTSGEIGNTYQLSIELPEGTRYLSEPEKMLAVPSMENLSATFVANKKAAFNVNFNGYHEIAIDLKDPADERNFYTWEWNLYEKQIWCRSCLRGVYAVNKIIPGRYLYKKYFVSGDELFEDCFIPQPVYDNQEAPELSKTDWTYDYTCRTQCWEVLKNVDLNLFDDNFTNGGQILQRPIARIPFYQRSGCLVEVRQLSLSKSAYEYYKLFQQQSENGGGIADTPPTALRGNIKNMADEKEVVVGYFSASAVSSIKIWLDRKDTGNAVPPGLFQALYARDPNPEPDPPYDGPRGMPLVLIWGGPPRVPTALCLKSNSRTPQKPDGWRDE